MKSLWTLAVVATIGTFVTRYADMPIKHCIIHKIERTVPGEQITVQSREEELPSEGPIASLFEQYKLNFLKRSQKQYGHFNVEAEGNPLPGLLREHVSKKITFTHLSQAAMQHLKLLLDSVEDAFSASVLFVFEELGEQNSAYVFWLNHESALQITRDLEVQETQFMDTSKLQYAAKIDLQEWLDDDTHKYMSLLATRGNKPFTDAFTQFMAFEEGVDLVAQTTEFLEIVEEYAEALPEESAKEYKTKLMDYCIEQNQMGAPVFIEELSSQLDERKPEVFVDFVVEKQQQKEQIPKTEIHTDRASLKRYIRFAGRDKNMSISFASDVFGEAVEYDEKEGALIIKQMPKSLKEQLNRYKNKAG